VGYGVGGGVGIGADGPPHGAGVLVGTAVGTLVISRQIRSEACPGAWLSHWPSMQTVRLLHCRSDEVVGAAAWYSLAKLHSADTVEQLRSPA
jgi:hypothetical protein